MQNFLNMTENRVSYTLDSSLDSVNQAEESALQFAKQTGFAEDDIQRISMAVREGVVNAVLHGNQYDPNKKVRISLEVEGDSLVIRIADEGSGLDPGNIPDPLAPENLLKTSGRGIFLIRAFMDDVKFKSLNPGTEITLIKRVSGEAEGAKESSQ